MKDMAMKNALKAMRGKGIDLTIVIAPDGVQTMEGQVTEPTEDEAVADGVNPDALMDQEDKAVDKENAELGLAPVVKEDSEKKMAGMLDKGAFGKMSGLFKKKPTVKM